MDHFHRPRRHPLGNQDPLTLPQTESPSMKLRLSILLLAAALAAAPAAGQTIKSLGYNTTNGFVTYSGSNSLTFTNALQFSTNARAATRTNLGGTTVGNALFTAATTSAARVALGGTIVGENIFTVPIQYQELYLRINADNTVSSLSPAAVRTNLGLGATNAVTFSNITASGTLAATGNVTMSGVNNTATAQTADSASSLMTRALTDQRQTDRAIAGPRMVWLTTFTGWETAVSGGTVTQNVYLRAATGTNQWNYAIARNFQTGELFTGSGDVFNFSKAGGYGAAFYSPGASYRDGTSVIYLGAASSYVPSTGSAVSNPATKGFGWRIKDESIVATMFNTNYVEVATNSAVLSSGATTRENVWLYIDWNGSGGATWYVNGSSVASTTNGPTGATSVNNGYLVFGSVADIPLTTQSLTSITAFVLDREP